MIKRLALALGATLAAATAVAAEPELIKQFDAWYAFKAAENGATYCYMAAVPEKDEGDYSNRGDILASITHRPAEKTWDTVSFRAGYTYAQGSEVEVAIGTNKFVLFTKEGMAWATDSEADRKLVAAMKAGIDMVVKGVSNRGTKTTDTYSLKGFTAAHTAINSACGRK